MKIVIETFVTVIFVTVFVLLAAQLIESQLAINEAKDFHTNVVKVLEESNFNECVIEECKSSAAQVGYSLEVEVEQTKIMQCLSCNSTWEYGEEKECATCGSHRVCISSNGHRANVVLNYVVKLTLLDIEREGAIVANAR